MCVFKHLIWQTTLYTWIRHWFLILCELLNVSARQLTEKMTLGTESNCTASHQCELLNVPARHLLLETTLGTVHSCMVSHQCEL